DGPRLVGQVERVEPQRARQLVAVLPSLVALRSDCGPRAVELVGATRSCECLQRVQPETAGVRIERGKRRRTADVCHPPAMSQGQSLGGVCDRRVRDAEKCQLRVLSQLDAALLEALCDGRANAAASDDLNPFD